MGASATCATALLCFLLAAGLSCSDARSLKAGPAPKKQPNKKNVQLERLLYEIRRSRAGLQAFFYGFPKGSELHYHYSGGVPTEDLIQSSIEADLYICKQNWTVVPASRVEPNATCPWVLMRSVAADPAYNAFKGIRTKILEEWSIYNYEPEENETPAAHFFATFSKFSAAKDVNMTGQLLKMKARAIQENIQYMEIMLTGPRGPALNASYEARLLDVQTRRDLPAALALLDEIYKSVPDAVWDAAATVYAATHASIHGSSIDDEQFTLRYLAYATRVLAPLTVFSSFVTSFLCTIKSPLVNGVNLVAPENDMIALRDYWIHMVMVKYLKTKYPEVKVALHAGELTYDLVAPDDLRFHVKDAVTIAGADRIGHGVAIQWEDNSRSTLKYMAKNGIALELLLNSNEFILPESEGDRHSFPLYLNAGVPIVVSSDDPGILRTTLTREYVTLAYKYPTVKYSQIRTMALNGIRYSFIKDPALKARLLAKVQAALVAFESDVSGLRVKALKAMQEEEEVAAATAAAAGQPLP